MPDSLPLKWTALEAATLEHLLVSANALCKRPEKVSWSNAVQHAADAGGYEEPDVAAYWHWMQVLGDRDTTEQRFCWQHLAASAHRLLALAPNGYTLREDFLVPALERLVWRWVSLAVPCTSLIAAHSNAADSASLRMSVLHPSMAPATRAAVLHVHYGQLLAFEDLWKGIVLSFRTGGALTSEMTLRTAAPPPGFEYQDRRIKGTLWERALFAALAVRGFLELRAHERPVPPVLEAAAQAFADGNILRCSAFYWASLRSAAPRSQPHGNGRADVVDEAILQAKLFQRLRAQPTEDWATVFEQYLRVRAILYAHVTHRPKERGLAAFVNKAKNAEPYEFVAGAKRSARIETSGECLDVGALEARVTATRWVKERPDRYFPSLPKSAGRPNRLGCKQESAWLVAFNRASDAPSKRTVMPSHVLAYRSAEETAAMVERCMRAYPLVLRSTRGLDVMGLEQEGPLWIVLPALLRVRKLSESIAMRDSRAGIVPLRTTIHAGEDFDSYLTGLRQVSEPLLWRALKRGDRLGHAAPIGIDAGQWTALHPRLRVKWWDRLLDVGWAADCMHRFQLSYADKIPHLAESARRCVQHIWKRQPGAVSAADPLAAARALWGAISEPGILEKLNYPHGNVDPREVPDWMLYTYLFDRQIFEKASEQTCILDTAPDLSLSTELQQLITRLLANLQITIEVQPSSNLCVGGVASMVDQPFFQLRAPTDGSGPDAPLIAISSDDPLAFATNTEDEYGYAWAGMVAAGRAPSLATRWLQDVAEGSMRGRFTDPRSIQWASDAWRT
jgi:hypothetical protein